MEKTQAKALIEKVMQAPFNEKHFNELLVNMLIEIDTDKFRDWSSHQFIFDDFKDYIKQFKRPGLYTDPSGNELEVLIIEVESLTQLERARTALRNFVVKYLKKKASKGLTRDYALAAFYAPESKEDWRFSFIKMEYEDSMGVNGKVKTRQELSPAKRYSFLVGENENCYTAQKQLLPLVETDYSKPHVEEIEEAFGIEKVTDEFFQQYKALYHSLKESLDRKTQNRDIFKENGMDVARFTKKLLGQIVFLYFLQKKGWLGVKKGDEWGSGNKKFVQALFDRTEKKDFYTHYLQYLFYEALAKERNDNGKTGYYERFECKIPFLNGGLFEADYDWENLPITIPDDQFRNKDKNKAGDEGTGILDVFDRYNFTVKEDEPLEKEVAVDPEMLGKVFEKMLEVTERKSKGAFYTPREIVHYMCRESLVHYLDTAVNSPQLICPVEDLEQFIGKGQMVLENEIHVLKEGKETDTYIFNLPLCIRENAKLLDRKLEEIKICDPAIGSGAFPVGLLNEIVNARLVLQPFLGNDIADEKKRSILSGKLKRYAIQKNIYGVDIDPSAVDIARLRLGKTGTVRSNDPMMSQNVA